MCRPSLQQISGPAITTSGGLHMRLTGPGINFIARGAMVPVGSPRVESLEIQWLYNQNGSTLNDSE